MTTNPNQDAVKSRRAAEIYRSMALRLLTRCVDIRNHAEFHGGDLKQHGKLQTQLEACDAYLEAVGEWLANPIEDVSAALALVEFAGLIAIDRLFGEVTGDGLPAGEETDTKHQIAALTAAAGWLRGQDFKQYCEAVTADVIARQGGAA